MSKIQQPTENTNCWHTEKFHSWLSLAICSPNKLGREQLRIYFNIINTVITVELPTWTQVAILSSLAATSYQNISQVRTYSDSNCTETWRITTHQKITKNYSSFSFHTGWEIQKNRTDLRIQIRDTVLFSGWSKFSDKQCNLCNYLYLTFHFRGVLPHYQTAQQK